MIKLRSFSSALVSIVSVVEEEERKVAPSQCMVTWQDVLQLLGDVISIPMVNKNLGIMYAQILISNKFSKDSKFIKSLVSEWFISLLTVVSVRYLMFGVRKYVNGLLSILTRLS